MTIRMNQYFYSIAKITARRLFNNDFDLSLSNNQLEDVLINEPDNGYFGIVRILTKNKIYFDSIDAKNPAFMKEILFVDCNYNNITYDENCLKWATEQDDKEKQRLEKIKNNLENKKQTEEICKKLEKINYEIDNFSKKSRYENYIKKNKDVKKYEANLNKLLDNGFVLNGTRYLLLGMSGSMARNGIKGFASEDIYDDLMDYSYLIEKPKKCKIAKYEAYRNLLFTSCRAYVNELPRICVVEDYYMDIPGVDVKYPADGFFIKYDEDGSVKEKIPRKVMKADTKTIKINCFDGAAVHSSEYNRVLYNALPNVKSIPKSYQLRLPFLKGVSTCFDIQGFFKEKGIEQVRNIDGDMIPVDQIDILVTRSMYKGADFFSSFEAYYDAVKEKGFKLGISNFSKSSKESPEYSKINYQYLQNISGLTKEDLIDLSSYFTEYVDRILLNPQEAIELLNATQNVDEPNVTTPYTLQALSICGDMSFDTCVRSTVSKLVKNAIREAMYGRILIKGSYHYLVPDLYMLMCWVGQYSGYDISVCSSLMPGEIYCSGKQQGIYSVFRSPELLENEINVVQLVDNDITKRWFSHLDNILVVNSCSVDMMKLQTADHDGDEAFLCEEERITSKVKTGLPLIINYDEQKPPIVEYSNANIKDYHLKTLDCMIGQITNKSCCLHNKSNKLKTTNRLELDGTVDESRIKVLEDLEYLSIQIQLETDYVKNGIRWDTPDDIENNLGNLPYFMQYRYDNLKNEFKRINTKRNTAKNKILKNHGYDVSDKYDKTGKIDDKTRIEINNKMSEKKYQLPVNCSKTPLNELCWYLERWNPIIRYKIKSKDVTELYMPNGYVINDEKLKQIELIYIKYLADSNKAIKTKKDINWNVFYRRYKEEFFNICPDNRELLFYLLNICYEKDNKKSKNIVWDMCGETIIDILKERKTNIDRYNNRTDGLDKATA